MAITEDSIMSVQGYNELFKQWIEELLAEARGKSNTNMCRNLNKALDSISKCTEQLHSAQDALKLKGIGPNIAGKLERKLCEHLGSDHASSSTSSSIPISRTAEPLVTPGFGLTQMSHVEPIDDLEVSRQKKPKIYVPALHSGGYAVLLAFYGKFGLLDGSLSKSELIQLAQSHCSTSFTVPDRDRYYTAWSSMNTLIKHELVVKWGSPPQFSLTEKGKALAEKLYNSRPMAPARPPKTPPPMNPSPTAFLRPFRFTYVDASDGFANVRSAAAVKVIKRVKHYKICFPQAQKNHSIVALKKVVDINIHPEHLNEYSIGFLHSGFCTEFAPGLSLCGSSPVQSPYNSSAQSSPLVATPSVSSSFKCSSTKFCAPEIDSTVGSFEESINLATNMRDVERPFRDIEAVHPFLRGKKICNPYSSFQQDDCTLLSKADLIKYIPGSYEIVCVLDNREVVAQKDRDHFQRLLSQRGVLVDTRPLEIGDFMWIARPKFDLSKPSVALDVILERKRLDDLVASVRDGRFVEQKLRLLSSGAKRIIYLLETAGSYDSISGFGASRVYSSLMRTLVIDKVSVYRSAGPEETCNFLATVTSILSSELNGKTLYVIPSVLCQRAQIKHSLGAYIKQVSRQIAENVYVTFETLCEHSSKTKGATINSLFLRQLLVIRGMTLPKARRLVERFHSWSRLMQALVRAEDEGLNLVDFLLESENDSLVPMSDFARGQFSSLIGHDKLELCSSWLRSMNPNLLSRTLATKLLDVIWSLDYLLPYSKASSIQSSSSVLMLGKSQSQLVTVDSDFSVDSESSCPETDFETRVLKRLKYSASSEAQFQHGQPEKGGNPFLSNVRDFSKNVNRLNCNTSSDGVIYLQ